MKCAHRPLWPVLRAWIVLALVATVANPALGQQGSPRNRNPRQQPQQAQQRITWEPGAEARSKHYRILSDLEPEDTKLYAGHLDRLYEEWFDRYTLSPTLVIDTSEVDYVEDLFHREALIDELGVDARGVAVEIKLEGRGG